MTGKSFIISSIEFIEDNTANDIEFIGVDKLLNNKFSNFIELKNRIESILLVNIEITDIVTTSNFKYILFNSGNIRLINLLSKYPKYKSKYRYYNIYSLGKIKTIIDSPCVVDIAKPLFRFQNTESASSILRKLEIKQSLILDHIRICKDRYNGNIKVTFNSSEDKIYLQDENSVKNLTKDFIKYIELGIPYGDDIYRIGDQCNDLEYVLDEYHKIYPDIISDKTIYINSKMYNIDRLIQIIYTDRVSYIFNGDTIDRNQINTSGEVNKMVNNLKSRLSNL